MGEGPEGGGRRSSRNRTEVSGFGAAPEAAQLEWVEREQSSILARSLA